MATFKASGHRPQATKESMMSRASRLLTRTAAVAATTIACLAATGCADMTPRERNTAVGAAVGGVAGSVLSNGSAVGTVGGAAVGGVVGNQVGKRR
jgi:osmotically inducible lipoprotein OsmB